MNERENRNVLRRFRKTARVEADVPEEYMHHKLTRLFVGVFEIAAKQHLLRTLANTANY